MRWVISILFIVLFQWYAFQAIKTITNERSILVTYWFIVIAILGNILWHTLFFDRSGGFTHSLSYSIGFLLSSAIVIRVPAKKHAPDLPPGLSFSFCFIFGLYFWRVRD